MAEALFTVLYFVTGVAVGVAFAVADARGRAREGRLNPYYNASEILVFCAFAWPLMVAFVSLRVVGDRLTALVRRLARVERLPEVVARRNEELEKELGDG